MLGIFFKSFTHQKNVGPKIKWDNDPLCIDHHSIQGSGKNDGLGRRFDVYPMWGRDGKMSWDKGGHSELEQLVI